MKRYRYLIVSLAAAMLCLTSCDDMLDEDPLYTQNSSVVFETEDNAELALLGCYAYLTANYAYGQMWQEVPIVGSGLSWTQRSDDDGGLLGELAVLASNSLVSYAWDGMYTAISECNAFIESMNSSSLDDDVKVQKVGEAKFIRALCYYNLAAHFGDVPLKTVASTSEGIALPRTAKEEVYAQVVADLIDAQDIADEADCGRATSWAAKAFLGKVYYKMAMLDIDADENLENAKELFDDVYNNGPYELDDSYAGLFDTYVSDSKEAIIILNFCAVSSSGCYNRGSNRFAPQASTSGVNWSTYRVMKYSYDLHEGTYPGDPRLKTNFLTQWRTRTGNNTASPKTQVGSELTPNDSSYTYPYWVFDSETEDVPGAEGTALDIVGKLPYDKFDDPTNPSISVMENYQSLYGESQLGEEIENIVSTFTAVGSSTTKWPFYGKMYDQAQSGTMSHKNLMVYRYAEMLLIMADVYNELGYTSKAISLANEVLARARQSDGANAGEPADWSTSLTQSEVTEKLYFERIIELMGEPNIYDMVRIRGTEYMKKLLTYNIVHELTILGDSNYDANVNSFCDYQFNDGVLDDEFLKKNLLLPIPTSEIDANSALTNDDNNYGY